VDGLVLNPPVTLLLLHAKPLTARRRSETPAEYRPLDALGIALAVPLVTRAGSETVLCLLAKLSHDTFDRDDLELLAPVIRQATAALDNALLVTRLEEKITELRGAYRRIAGEQEAERARLARELHDGTAQEIAGLITLAAVMDRQLGRDASAGRQTLERLRRQAEDAYQGVRRASHALRPAMLDDFGLAPTLTRYVERFSESAGIEVDCTIAEIGELPDDVELALFRVAQECLENVRKHSGTRGAGLRLFGQGGYAHLEVWDNGRGLPDQVPTGLGLSGMRERVEAVGGTIRIESDDGVRIEAIVPLAVVAPA
jgi:signal transduction histidine kinase